MITAYSVARPALPYQCAPALYIYSFYVLAVLLFSTNAGERSPAREEYQSFHMQLIIGFECG